MNQKIQFCRASDGVSIAFSSVGSGPPLIKSANWMNHLELDWHSPVWNHLLQALAATHQLIRYDERGTGLSDRKVEDLSQAAFVDDLEAVVDATKVDKFALLGISQGGPVAIDFARRHPDKVSHLILIGSFAQGWKKAKVDADVVEKRQAQVTLIRQGWNSRNPAIRQLWTTLCIPDGTPDEIHSFNELQQESVSAEGAARIFDAIGDLDVAAFLSDLTVPTLVLHSRADALVPFEEGRRMAAMIPNARFVSLDSRDHLVLSHEPAWNELISEIQKFLGVETPDAATLTLKACPLCGRTYSDVSMMFCLDDGSRLSGYEEEREAPENETRILPAST